MIRICFGVGVNKNKIVSRGELGEGIKNKNGVGRVKERRRR